MKRTILHVAAACAIGAAAARLSPLFLSAAAQQKRSTWDGIFTEAQVERGRALYESGCTNCHGPLMNGMSFAPPIIGPNFLGSWDGLPLAALFDRVRSMPPESGLSRQQWADVVAFVLSRNGFPAGETELSGQADQLNQTMVLANKP